MSFMKRLVLALCIITGSLQAKLGDNVLLGAPEERQLIVDNRILINVNGKPLSVVDVMKKMDMIFYQQFPEYANNLEARYQFYQFRWKRTLQDLIDKELILADAKENKMPITNGDVRQEMEYLFGPNIIANLDKIGMSYDEAAEMVRGDIILKRMIYYRVNAKAERKVTPQLIREAYEQFARDNQKPGQWTYQVISFRNDNASVGATVAHTAHALLEQEVALGQLSTQLDTIGVKDGTNVNISEEFVQSESEVNPSHLEILKNLVVGAFSKPIEQLSRDQSKVYRIFYLKAKQEAGTTPFDEAAKTVAEDLLDKATAKESTAYFAKLRQHYGITESYLSEMVTEDFEPFRLK